jgi:hypothetical protein
MKVEPTKSNSTISQAVNRRNILLGLAGLSVAGCNPHQTDPKTQSTPTSDKLVPSVEAATQPPAFEYGNACDHTNQVYKMNDNNSLPAMVVWMMLTTNPDLQSDVINNKADVGAIASAVNLKPTCVKKVFEKFRQASTPVKNSFGDVAAMFQDFAHANGYPQGHCPKNPQAIYTLGQKGAQLADPGANCI